jgi:hypothetical protein
VGLSQVTGVWSRSCSLYFRDSVVGAASAQDTAKVVQCACVCKRAQADICLDGVQDGDLLADYGIEEGSELVWKIIEPTHSWDKEPIEDPLVLILTAPRILVAGISTVERSQPVSALYPPVYISLNYRILTKYDPREWSKDYLVAFNGQILDSSKTWAEYGLEQGTWLSLIPIPGRHFQIFYRSISGTRPCHLLAVKISVK